jgi:hypothetical protein
MSSPGDDKAAWIERVLGVRIAPDVQEAMAAWQAERKLAIAQLTKLEMLVRASNHPEADAAVKLLRPIRANLTETPETANQVAELVRYIEDDEIFVTAEMPNVFGVAIDIRAPLGRALAGLRAAMTSKGG